MCEARSKDKHEKSKDKHKAKVTPLERVVFRFFMLTMEVHNLASKLKIKKAMSVDDWVAMMQETYALMKQGKIAYVQLYTRTKQPLDLIMQDKCMSNMCICLLKNNAWALDSTFKANIFGLPLYAAVAPNEHGVHILLWYMLCTNGARSQHE